jgi:t-SNARE complex subunit (syntaxin)
MTTTTERERELTSGLTPLITDTNKRAALAKSLLQRLKEECDSLRSSDRIQQNDLNELRIRENLINTLTRKFVDVMKAYQNAQQVFKVELKKKMKRQVLIVKPEATQEEIEEVIKTGGGTGEIYKTAILKVRPSPPPCPSLHLPFLPRPLPFLPRL